MGRERPRESGASHHWHHHRPRAAKCETVVRSSPGASMELRAHLRLVGDAEHSMSISSAVLYVV
eukprot:1304887-Prymnesium_polylepis.2